MCQHTDPGMTLKHRDFDSFGSGRYRYLCKSLRTINLVWLTRLAFLAMGEVLSFGFNLVVLDPSDRRGTDTYCIAAIEDNKMGFSSYCLSLSRYIMSSYLMHYSVL